MGGLGGLFCIWSAAGTKYRSARLGCTCGTAIYDLQSAYQTAFADFLRFFIRNRRFAYIVCIGFLNEEYLIASVDFIVALRRTKGRGRRTLRSPPSPSSGLHLIHPGYPLRRGILAAAVYRDIVSLYPVQVDNPQFRMLFCYLCSGWYRSRFSRVAQLVSHVFHYWGGDRSCLRLRVVWLYTLVGFALTAIGSFLLVGNGRGWSVSLVA